MAQWIIRPKAWIRILLLPTIAPHDLHVIIIEVGIVVQEKTKQSLTHIYEKWRRKAINAANTLEFPTPRSLARVING